MDVKREDLLQLYYYLKLTRRLEDRVTSLYHQGKILGALGRVTARRRFPWGTAMPSRRNDIAAPYFRDMGVFLIRGISAKRIMAQYFGKKTGVTGGKRGTSTLVI